MIYKLYIFDYQYIISIYFFFNDNINICFNHQFYHHIETKIHYAYEAFLAFDIRAKKCKHQKLLICFLLIYKSFQKIL